MKTPKSPDKTYKKPFLVGEGKIIGGETYIAITHKKPPFYDCLPEKMRGKYGRVWVELRK